MPIIAGSSGQIQLLLRVLTVKLTVSQIVNKFPRYYGPLSWARSIQSMSFHPIPFRCILTLFTCLFLGIPSLLYPEFPVQNSVGIWFFLHISHMSCLSASSFHYLNYIWWEALVRKLLILQSFPVFCYFLLLSPKYLPQHPILEHPQAMFIP
jgi:hypothetical protein